MSRLLLSTLVLTSAQGVICAANAATITWRPDTSGITVNPTSLQQTVDGITVTAQGFVAEVDGADARVLGPYPTSAGMRGNRAFGIDLRDLGGEQLGLLAQEFPGIPAAEDDFGSAVAAPGFNTSYVYSPFVIPEIPPEKFDFAHFTFDTPVDIGAVVVDDVSNFDRNIWMASGTVAPDFGEGLLDGLSGYTFVNSADDAGDGLFTHNLDADGITHLLVGAPAENGLGPLVAGDSQFYIDSFIDVSVDDNGNGTPDGNGTPGGGGGQPGVVPVPPSFALLLTGMLGFGVARRRRG